MHHATARRTEVTWTPLNTSKGPQSSNARERCEFLLIDDDRNIRRTLGVCLEHAGCEVVQAASGDWALRALQDEPCDLAFLDLHLGDESGQDLIPRLTALCPGMQIVVITAYATIESAVETLRLGAWDYLAKPFKPEQVVSF